MKWFEHLNNVGLVKKYVNQNSGIPKLSLPIYQTKALITHNGPMHFSRINYDVLQIFIIKQIADQVRNKSTLQLTTLHGETLSELDSTSLYTVYVYMI